MGHRTTDADDGRTVSSNDPVVTPVFGGRPELPLTLSALVSTTTTTSTRHKPSAPVPARPGDRATLAPAVARRRPRCRPTLPGSRLIRRADAAHWNRSSQLPVVAAHTGRSSPSPYTVSQTWCYISQHPLSSLYSAQTALPLDCSLRCHSLPNTRAFTSTHYSQLISLAKVLRQPLKHVRFTCTESPDRHTVDLTAIHVTMHSCPHVASENNNETDRFT